MRYVGAASCISVPHCKLCWTRRPVIYSSYVRGLCDCADNCDGDQEWTDCGSETTLTCEDPDAGSTAGDACVPRCQCPADRPVWDDDRQMCINADECVDYWK